MAFQNSTPHCWKDAMAVEVRLQAVDEYNLASVSMIDDKELVSAPCIWDKHYQFFSTMVIYSIIAIRTTSYTRNNGYWLFTIHGLLIYDYCTVYIGYLQFSTVQLKGLFMVQGCLFCNTVHNSYCAHSVKNGCFMLH